MADFGILQTPNFANAVLSGYSAGQTLGRQQRLDTALGGVDLERPETIIPILQADPTTGAALLGTSVRYAEMKHEQAKANAIGSALSDYFSGGAGASKPAGTIPVSVPASTPATPTPAAPDTPDEVTITAPKAPAPDAEHTIARILEAGGTMEQAKDFISVLGSLDTQHKAALADSQDAISHAALQLRQIPADQRRAALDAMAPDLMRHHVTMEQINGADLSDGGLEGIWNQSRTVAEILTGKREDEKFAYQKQHDAKQDSMREQEIGISAGNLGVSRRRLADEEKGLIGQNGKPTGADPMSALPQPLTKAAYDALPPNTRYRAPDGSIKIKGAH